ncbi:uncharacterized protein rps6kl1 isoform X1 [Rhincodon typus]|uniref:uncharacterized protein rps6kl1 isoform X1 n=1 Tax=Rhincodon typus TaxID=259920 RepID=UPI00203081F1|nr:uncharacterized protein rps6kl1 isoform X1 [Rhincodon typus]XP_048455874.1 uncharacterized protein rps6kl1 isoform X1 [Rhincodon typus]XP_048455875.1 uncharacterized protein rps6kl1 isoform X1 [Rhincodon typus]
MYSLPGRRSPGQDAETCSRPLSQARVYLEQIRSRVSPSISESHQATRSTTSKRDYLVDAAKQIRLALDREVNEDYEAAFNYYKNGVDLLLKGVQVDPNKERREAVKRKTTQYLKRAEEIFNSHLQGSLGNGTDDSGGFSSLRFRPNRILSSPVEDLKTSKVIAIVDKVLLVQNPSSKEPFIVKSLPKCSLVNRECPTIIPQGVPFMVQLLQYYVSDDAVFLHLEHVPAGKLWSQLRHLRPSVAEKGMEFPECSSPHHTTIKMRNSYTAPSLSSMCCDNSVLPPNSKREWQKETKNEINGEYDNKYGYSTDGINDPKSSTSQGFVKDQASHRINGTDQLSTHNASAKIWRGNNGISKGCIALNGLRGSAEGTSFQVAQLIYSADVTFDLTALLPAKDAKLTPSSKTANHTMTITVDHLMQNDLQSEKSQLLYEDKILRSHECFLETKSFNDTLSPKSSETNQSQAASDLLKEKAILIQEEPVNGSSPIRSPVRATSLNLKASRRQGQRGSYQITVNPLDTIEDSSKVTGVMDNSELVLVRASSVMPVRNTAVTVLGKGLSEQKTSVSVLGPVQQPNTHLISSLIEQPVKSLKSKGISTNDMEVLNHEGESPKIDHLFQLPNQIPVPETHCDCEDCDARTILCTGCLHKAENGGCCSRISGSSAPDKAEEREFASFSTQHSKAELPDPNQTSSSLSDDHVRIWAAEMVLALESLHQQGIICLDLNPRNILVDNAGHVCLTYFGQWSEVEVQCSTKAIEDMYCAPEVGGVGRVTEACDWWSLGALLFELLTGMTLSQCYPSRIHSHTQLRLPDHLSPAAVSLLQQLLQWDYRCRLGSGENGAQEVKSHSFFSTVNWDKLNGYR